MNHTFLFYAVTAFSIGVPIAIVTRMPALWSGFFTMGLYLLFQAIFK